MSDSEQLSDEQRITLLEGKVGKNRTVIIIVAVIMVIVLSVSFTVLILKLFNADEPYVVLSSFDQQAAIIDTMQMKIDKQASKIGTLSLTYQQSQVATFQQTMIEQERSYQDFLSALKMGMFDLAKMVQGSRTWLDVYNDRLDDARDLSMLREENLKSLK
ncbi:MAG: hypothetical protein ACJAR6_000336 [Oleispira sp.]|jgi:hypothetical protein